MCVQVCVGGRGICVCTFNQVNVCGAMCMCFMSLVPPPSSCLLKENIPVPNQCTSTMYIRTKNVYVRHIKLHMILVSIPVVYI